MNAENFLTNFGQIASAPEGINRLREMIYNLAVTGVLSEQRHEDGDGHALLAEIKEKKQRLIEAGIHKRSPKIENLRDAFNESLPKIPSSWAWARLVDVGEISPKNEADDDTMVSFASMSAISEKHAAGVAHADRLWSTIKKGYTHFADGDVVLAKITPCFENGKAAVMANLTNGIGAGTTELHVIRPIAQTVEPGFIYVFLRSPYFKIVGEGYMTGTAGQKRLPTEYFATRPLPLPPLAEQNRIVAKVDELMALCDQLEEQQLERERRFPELSRACHASFAEAPTPSNIIRIFDEIGAVAPADLRKTIRTLAIDGKFYGTQQDQENWRHLKLKDVCLLITDGEHATPERTSEGIPLATAKNIRDGFLDLKNTDWLSIFTAEKCWKRCKPRHDDVLMVCVGATIGRVCLVQNPPDMVLVRSVALLRPNTEVIRPDYLDHFLRSPLGQSQIWAGVKQNAQPCLYLGRMNEFALAVPPLAEQRRIVAKVNQLMALVDHLEMQQRAKDKLAEAFARACVASFIGTKIERREKMKAPKTELVSVVTIGKKLKPNADAPLATLLSRHKGELAAKALWQQSGLAIDAFYQQLKTEIAQGWIAPPKEAEMKIVTEA